jgi:hypothetical protein
MKVQKQKQEQNETSEVTSQVLTDNPADCKTEVIITQSLLVAKRFHSMIAYFEANKMWIVELRSRFGVTQGRAGQPLNIEGRNILWSEFVASYFNVSLRWMNELLEIKEKPEPSPKPIEDKPLFQKGYAAGRQSVEGAAEIDRKIAEGIDHKYEAKIADLKKESRVANALPCMKMLIRLMEAIENGDDQVSLNRLVHNFRQRMKKLDEPSPAVTPAIAVGPEENDPAGTSCSTAL